LIVHPLQPGEYRVTGGYHCPPSTARGVQGNRGLSLPPSTARGVQGNRGLSLPKYRCTEHTCREVAKHEQYFYSSINP